MKLVTAVIRPRMLDDVKAALAAFGVADIAITPSFGCDQARTGAHRGVRSRVGLVPMARIQVVVDLFDAEDVATVIAAAAAARTGIKGDGEVRISGVDRVIPVGGGQLCWNGA